MPLWLDRLVMGGIDAAYAARRYPVPPADRLAATRVISHRGERDDRTVFENTYAAFDPLRGSGVHGIELDVRWTRDLVPVVFHDADFVRLYGDGTRLADLDFAALRRRRPEVPSLHELVRRYVDAFHLMVEIKHEPYPDPALQNARFAEALAPALERGGCHVLSLVPAMFAWLPAISASRTMGISRLNADAVSAEALAAGRAGFSGHYLSTPPARIARHHAAGQVVGCGFPASPAVLYREIGRGVDYVFTNCARRVEAWRREAAQAAPAPGTPAPPH